MRDASYWRIDEQAADGRWTRRTHITAVRVGQTPAGVVAAYRQRLAARGQGTDRPLRAVLVAATRPTGAFESWFRGAVAPLMPAAASPEVRDLMLDELLCWSFLFVAEVPGHGPTEAPTWQLDADAVVQALPDLLDHLIATEEARLAVRPIGSLDDWLTQLAAGQLPPAVAEPAGRDLRGAP